MRCHGCLASAAEITRLHGELDGRKQVLADLQGRYNDLMDENKRLRGVEIGRRVEAGRRRDGS